MNRPLGVTIIAILSIISGILLVFVGLSSIGTGALFSIASTDGSNNPNVYSSMNPSFGIAFLLLGAILLVVGIGYIVASYGLLKGKGWAWTILVILTITGIIAQVISGITVFIIAASVSNDPNSIMPGALGQIIGLAVDIAILYYLYRPHVKAFFGKTPNSMASST
jgi:hypothetical protein